MDENIPVIAATSAASYKAKIIVVITKPQEKIVDPTCSDQDICYRMYPKYQL